MKQIQWGIIGCGDVTERKSGPAFNKVPDSKLVAVMRRDEEKARDYARRHKVPKWYSKAEDLLHDPEVNAIYIATPPDSHEAYCLEAIKIGKPVYVEKPMTLNPASAQRMTDAANKAGIPLSVAHYRRGWPLFNKLKELIETGAIGQPRIANLELYRKALSVEDLQDPKKAWRVDTKIAGGGLFHDLSPHQLDIFLFLFGKPDYVRGWTGNQAGIYAADDMVAGTYHFANGLILQGSWCFTVGAHEEKDRCCIVGDKGSLQFSFFDKQELILYKDGKQQEFKFDALEHVQQPMIQKVVDYFLGRGPNHSSGEEGVEVMKMITDLDSSD